MSRDFFQTHEVLNQSPPFEDVNLFTSDPVLPAVAAREGAGWAAGDLAAFGAVAGAAATLELGRLANENPPRLRRFDAQGRPLDRLETHPAYHEIMTVSARAGLHCSAWEHLREGREPRAGAHVARCAGLYMAAQMEAGHCCPITMTNACVPTLLLQPDMAKVWLPRLLVRDFDPSFRPAGEKRAVTFGMAMTERQGGTDVRANTTRAEPAGDGRADGYRIAGSKWFMSAPMSDAFFVLAQAPGGLSCFLAPRFLPDGSVNAIRLQRLKDKLGNRSNASSEVEFHDAIGWLVGEEGRGVPAIIEMVTLTRLDCAVSSAGLMRFALAHAIHHARHRTVFQKRLVDHPLMLRVLADLALDAEAAALLAFRLARAFDRAGDEAEAAFQRLMTPAIKYWVCKTAPNFAYEAMECMGGNGYVEELPLARIYREAPLNAIWEGSGNVMCLDVLRVLRRSPDAARLALDGLSPMARGDRRLESALAGVADSLGRADGLEADLRQAVEALALVAAGCLLRADAPDAVADAFIGSRLAGGWRSTYGAGLSGADDGAIVARAGPILD